MYCNTAEQLGDFESQMWEMGALCDGCMDGTDGCYQSTSSLQPESVVVARFSDPVAGVTKWARAKVIRTLDDR